MARYIKANPKVAKFLNLERDRNTVADGNYLLWQADMLAFGPLTLLSETLQQIGGIALLAHEAREEQDGTVTRPLPVATDPRFVMDEQQQEQEPEQVQEAQAEGTQENENTDDNQNESSGEGEGTGESETQAQADAETEAETPANEQEGETPNDDTESETINAGDVGSVEDLVDFTGENNENTEG